MPDYSQHQYKNLLEFIDNGCQQINEERDFGSYLLSMEQADSIEEIIEIFNNVYKLLAVIFFKTKYLPPYWYRYEIWSKGEIDLTKQLFDYVNESILNWWNRQENPTDAQKIACVLNLKEGRKIKNIESVILVKDGKDVSNVIFNLINIRNHHFSLREKVDNYNRYKDKRKYNELMNNYINYSNILAEKGHIFDVIEETFAQQNNIDYKLLLTQYKDMKNRIVRLYNEQETAKKREDNNRKTYLIILGFAIAFIVICCILSYIKIDPVGLFLLIGLPGALLSFLKKGKI